MSTADSVRERVRDRYRDQLGRARREVTTPALLLDLDVARRNIDTMARKFDELPAKLRPHIKVHKSIELARMTVDAGAVGVACATAWEAIVMARGGIADVLIANQVVQRDKVAAVAELARDHRITVAVDDVRNVEQLAWAAANAGSRARAADRARRRDGPLRRAHPGGGAAHRRADRRVTGLEPSRHSGLRGSLHARARP